MARVSNRNPKEVSAAPQGILMAVCEIWDVRGRLDHPIDYAENPEKTANPKYAEADLQAMVDVMEYATNKDKTEQRFFVTGVNCDPTTARHGFPQCCALEKHKRCQHFLRASVR